MSEKHLTHYMVLLTGLLILLVFFIYFRYDRSFQIVIAGAASLFYSLWGVFHHALENRLNKLIALEYILIGTFVFFLLSFVLSL